MRKLISTYKESLNPYFLQFKEWKCKNWDDLPHVDRRERLTIAGLVLFSISLLKKS